MNPLRIPLVPLLVVFPLVGETYYVSTTGNNSNGGTDPDTDAWLTISFAASNAVAGDVVLIGPGTFREYMTNFVNSGTPVNPITYQGTVSGTNWLTILDPSTAFTNNWVYAPEVGAGVYKQTNMPFVARELTVNRKRVAFVYAMGDMEDSINDAYESSGLTEGREFLGLATNAQLTLQGGGAVVFWDGIEAIYGVSNTTAFLRFRNSNDPNGMLITASGNSDSGYSDSIVRPAIRLSSGDSNIVIRGIAIRGAFSGVQITGSTARDNVVESNVIYCGMSRVSLESGALKNTIRNNTLYGSYYGHADTGAWDAAESSYTNLVKQHVYLVAKYLMGVSDTFDHGIYITDIGSSNVLSGNTIIDGIGTGIEVMGDNGAPTTHTIISNNSVSGCASVGIHLSVGHTETLVCDNVIADCNINTRWHRFNEGGQSNRVVYFCRNTLWLPCGVGNHIYIHYNADGGGYRPPHWAYHNSFSGGYYAINISTYAYDTGGMTNTVFVNNIFSGAPYIGGGWSQITNRWIVGEFDYNLLTPPYPTYPSTNFAAWVGANCIKDTAIEWSTNEIPSFALTNGSLAIDAALDVSSEFVLGGVSYPALPMSSIQSKRGSAWDIGALEYSDQASHRLSGPALLKGTFKLQ